MSAAGRPTAQSPPPRNQGDGGPAVESTASLAHPDVVEVGMEVAGTAHGDESNPDVLAELVGPRSAPSPGLAVTTRVGRVPLRAAIRPAGAIRGSALGPRDDP